MRFQRYFIISIIIVVAFEALFLLHAWVGRYQFSDIEGLDVLSIWATVITIVFIVFSIMGMMNIDSRIKELNDTKDRLIKKENEINTIVTDLKTSADIEKKKIIEKAQEELIKIIDKSAERQNTFDVLTQIANIPDPNVRIKRYTEILRTKTVNDGVNISYVHIMRGVAYKDLERDNEAFADFEQAIKISPNEAASYIEMGCFYVSRKKDYAKSIEYFQKAIDIEPSSSNIYVNIGNSYAKLGDYSEAEKYYKLANDYGVESFEWYYNKALALKDTGEDSTGDIQERYYKYCLRLNPHFMPATINLAATYIDKGNSQEAEQILTELIKNAAYHPDFLNAIIQRGECAIINKNYAGALNVFSLAYVYNSSNVLILLRLAQLNMRYAHLSEALDFARMGIAESTRQGDVTHLDELRLLEQNALDIIQKAEQDIFIGRKTN